MSLLDHFTAEEIDAQIDLPSDMLAYLERGRIKNEYRRWLARIRAGAKAEVLLKILDRHGVVLTSEQRDTITNCSEEARVDRWIERALPARTADELFG